MCVCVCVYIYIYIYIYIYVCVCVCVCVIFNTYIIKRYYSIISPFLYLPLCLRRDFAKITAIS